MRIEDKEEPRGVTQSGSFVQVYSICSSLSTKNFVVAYLLDQMYQMLTTAPYPGPEVAASAQW